MSAARNQVWFRCGTSEVTSRLIDGQYPNYAQVIPTGEPKTRVVVRTGDFLQALKAASVMATDSAHVVRIAVEARDEAAGHHGLLTLRTATNEVGDAEVVVAAEVTGPDASVALNSRYLADMLGAMGAKVEMRLNGPLDVVGLGAPDDEDYLGVIMPVRVNS